MMHCFYSVQFSGKCLFFGFINTGIIFTSFGNRKIIYDYQTFPYPQSISDNIFSVSVLKFAARVKP